MFVNYFSVSTKLIDHIIKICFGPFLLQLRAKKLSYNHELKTTKLGKVYAIKIKIQMVIVE